MADAYEHKGAGFDQRPNLKVEGGQVSGGELPGASSDDVVPGIEGLEGIREASVASDSASPALGAVHHISIAEAAHKHHSCTTTNGLSGITTACQHTILYWPLKRGRLRDRLPCCL